MSPSEAILTAAREITTAAPIPAAWQQCGIKNAPLLTLVDQLVGALEPVAAAIADNACDDCMPIPADAANALAERVRRIAGSIDVAATAPTKADLDDWSHWSMPSMSGKELV